MKHKFSQRNSEALEANIGRLRADRQLIENFIACRKELKRELYITPAALRNGQGIDLKPRMKSFQKRIEYLEAQKKAKKDPWKDAQEPKPVEQEKERLIFIEIMLLTYYDEFIIFFYSISYGNFFN